jgi:hypothetical protein
VPLDEGGELQYERIGKVDGSRRLVLGVGLDRLGVDLALDLPTNRERSAEEVDVTEPESCRLAKS